MLQSPPYISLKEQEPKKLYPCSYAYIFSPELFAMNSSTPLAFFVLSLVISLLVIGVHSTTFVSKGAKYQEVGLSYRSQDNGSDSLTEKGKAVPYAETSEASSINLNSAGALDNEYKAYLNKGVVLQRLGNYTQALDYYDKALSIDPKAVVNYYDNALRIDPENVSALIEKATVLLILDNYTQALDYYDKALSIDPKAVVDYYDNALKIDPENALALVNKANVLGMLGNYTQALDYMIKLLV
jgi:tetratricopeptide (TPR) repeat protein